MKTEIVKVLVLASAISCTVSEAKTNKDKSLPPGLEKKVNRMGQLPPGWQKKLAVGKHLDTQVYKNASVMAPVQNDGIVTVEVDGRVIRLIEATREIVEILR
ncbi:hypothetical protein [Salinimonas iocasae]|uniref:Uncharacterized protein n=1 Tax=Salinimonas iocasae TaxID=2572577 RepID=A0A5B7YC07_9ALTE|nr:hypothetical protein [Salinimonas iocasae]QCZ93131.1 hypothetical protein FBQ74_06345 [Salinimonas iocasae]